MMLVGKNIDLKPSFSMISKH